MSFEVVIGLVRLYIYSSRKKAVAFTTVTMSSYQDQINAEFSKVCEIVKVCSIDSLIYIQEFNTPVCYCGEISMP